MADTESERCPNCGQPLPGEKQSTYEKLREATSEALERARVADAAREEVEADRDDLLKRMEVANAELRRLRLIEDGVVTGQIPAVTPPPEG